MNGLSFSATTEKRKGILLDPRTKLILLLTITTLMFSTSNEGIMNIVKPCLSLVPFALILSERRFKTAGKYLVLYAVCFILERIALTSLSGLLSFIVLAVTSIMTRFAPGIMTGAYLISSTSISEFIGAMERMHITEKIVIPMSVIFRFFPTISEEYQAIRDAMKMRGIWPLPECFPDGRGTGRLTGQLSHCMGPVYRKAVRVHGFYRQAVSEPCRHHPALGR